jgi:hypothetical protein
MILQFELRASFLLGRLSATQASPPIPFFLAGVGVVAVWIFFKIGFFELFARVGFEPQSS